MSAADEGRTEKATPKKRDKARGEGQVAKSQEVNSMTQYLMGYVVMAFFGGYLFQKMGEIARHIFTNVHTIDVGGDLNLFNLLQFKVFVIAVGPLFFALFFAVFAVNIAQFGFRVTWKAIQPKGAKLNVFKNFKRVLFSKNTLVELAKSLAKLAVMSILIYIAVTPLFYEFPQVIRLNPFQIAMKTWEYASAIWIYIIAFMLVLAIADYSWQRYQHEEQLKMKPEEVKDEQKQAVGNMDVKRKQREFSMKMLQKIIQQQASQADVVITNPTHFAIGLQYKHGKMNAPKVVAKGADYAALRIRKIARNKNIPIVENRRLARALYYACEAGQEIPESLFRPVAEILAFIYKMKKERGQAT